MVRKSGSCQTSQMWTICSTEKFRKFQKKNQMELKVLERNFQKFGNTLQGCPLFWIFEKNFLEFQTRSFGQMERPLAVIGDCHWVKTKISIFHDCSFGQLGVKDNKGQFEWHYTRCWEYKSISNNFIKYTYLSIHCQVPVSKVINTTRHYCHVVLCYLIDRVAWTMNIWFMLALYTCTSLPTFMKLGHMFCKIVFFIPFGTNKLLLLLLLQCIITRTALLISEIIIFFFLFWWRAQCLESSLKHAVFFWKKITFSALPSSLGPPLFCLMHFVVSDTSDSTWVIKA